MKMGIGFIIVAVLVEILVGLGVMLLISEWPAIFLGLISADFIYLGIVIIGNGHGVPGTLFTLGGLGLLVWAIVVATQRKK